MERIKLDLIIEWGEIDLKGKVNYNNKLIIDFAPKVSEIEKKIKLYLQQFTNVDPEQVDFDYYYDMHSFFEVFDCINISKFANYANIHPGLMRQYASGVKRPALKQVRKIESALTRLSHEIEKVSINID